MKISKAEEKRYEELQLIALDFAREGNTEELRKMIHHGINVNLSTLKDDSLIMLASYNGNFETTKMLITKGSDINQVNQRGQTPLEGVCFKGNLSLVKLLIESGANLDNKAIIYASMFGHKKIVEYLSNKMKYKSFFKRTIKVTTIVTENVKKIYKKIFLKKKNLRNTCYRQIH